MNRHLIRIGALASAAMLAATQAHAVARIRADLNSCATVQQTIIRDGSAVVRYPSPTIFSMIVTRARSETAPSARDMSPTRSPRKTIRAASFTIARR